VLVKAGVRSGRPFLVLALHNICTRPRRLPIFGSSLVTSAIFGDQYEVRVRAWPHRLRDEVKWSTTVPLGDAFVVAHELIELLKQGQWRPNDGEPPLSAVFRASLGGPH